MDFQNNRSHRQEAATRTESRAMPITADSGCVELSRNSDQRERTISNRAEARTVSRAMPLLGRDELNLIDFPIGTLSYKQPLNADGSRPDELVFSVETFDQQLGRIIPKKLTTRTSSKYGFPTPKEEQLLVGLLLLTRMKNNFTQPRVEFRSGELFALMNWPHNSSSKRQLQTATTIDAAQRSAADEGEQQKLQAQTIRVQQLREQWNQLSDEKQQSIRATVYATANTFVQQRMDKHRYNDALVELACLNELERLSNQSAKS